jgi:threonine aldolase
LIDEAKRWRKVLGGGMRQAGIIAAAGLYALQHQMDDLAQDHQHAEQLANCLTDNFGDSAVRLATNMVHLNLPEDTYAVFAEHLGEIGIRVGRPRWVLHRDIRSTDLEALCRAIQGFSTD